MWILYCMASLLWLAISFFLSIIATAFLLVTGLLLWGAYNESAYYEIEKWGAWFCMVFPVVFYALTFWAWLKAWKCAKKI